MQKILELINPLTLGQRLLGAAISLGVVFCLGWYAIHSYNVKVTKDAVDKVTNTWTTKYNNLETKVINDRLAATSAANLEIAKEKDRANKATAKYQAELKANKALAAQRDSLRLTAADLDARLRDATKPITTSDGAGAEGVRIGSYSNGLARRYEQCERDLGQALETAAAAVDRASAAEAAARALSPVK